MSKFRARRPSPAFVVSCIALVMAMGGTSYAAFTLPASSVGTKQLKKGAVTTRKIKNGAVTTSKIKNGAVTAAKINTAGLTVPNALHADTAGSATNAVNADHATSADTVAGITRFKTTIQPSGSSFTDANTVTLGTSGPLSLIGKCYSSAGVTNGSFFLRTTAPAQYNAYNNQFNGAPLNPGTDEDVADNDASSTPPAIDFEDPADGTFAAITNSGSAYITGLASVATNLNSGNGCTFAGFTESG